MGTQRQLWNISKISPPPSGQPAGITITVAKLLLTAKTYKQKFKNMTMVFHTKLETVSRKFPEISKFSNFQFYSHLLKCPVQSAPSQALIIKVIISA